mmetsp:Transcript_69205/g.151127  ORF Transcript_69205/g.151127 Transcript_69205/m.151127 type:complete len:206 (+) Transcript_69205:53-670(+)
MSESLFEAPEQGETDLALGCPSSSSNSEPAKEPEALVERPWGRLAAAEAWARSSCLDMSTSTDVLGFAACDCGTGSRSASAGDGTVAWTESKASLETRSMAEIATSESELVPLEKGDKWSPNASESSMDPEAREASVAGFPCGAWSSVFASSTSTCSAASRAFLWRDWESTWRCSPSDGEGGAGERLASFSSSSDDAAAGAAEVG